MKTNLLMKLYIGICFAGSIALILFFVVAIITAGIERERNNQNIEVTK